MSGVEKQTDSNKQHNNPHLLNGPFIEQIRRLYQDHRYSRGGSELPTQTIDHQPKKKQKGERTRSKSRRKSDKWKQIPKRKSERIAPAQSQDKEFFEIEKEPIWNLKRLKSKTKRKLPILPMLKTLLPKPNLSQMTQITPSHPLYEFYSQYQTPKMIQSTPEIQISNPLQNQQKISQPEMEVQCSQIEENSLQIERRSTVDLENWRPNKEEAQLLSVQQIIDEFFIFKSNFRPSRTIELIELIKYVRDIQGYYFERRRLDRLLLLNPNLYKLIRINGRPFIKCGAIKEEDIGVRLHKTKISMAREKKNMQSVQ